MKYKTSTRSVEVEGVSLQILSLEDLNQTIDDLFIELEKSGNSALLEDLCPYFGTIWPSALGLSKFLIKSSMIQNGTQVLELGCGLAIPSLIAAKRGARVLATDYHPEVPYFLEENKRLNHTPALRYERIDWNTSYPNLGKFELILGSDVLYENKHSNLLAKTAADFSQKRSKIVIADPARPYLQSFVDEMKAFGFDFETFVETVPDTPVAKEVFITVFSQKP